MKKAPQEKKHRGSSSVYFCSPMKLAYDSRCMFRIKKKAKREPRYKALSFPLSIYIYIYIASRAEKEAENVADGEEATRQTMRRTMRWKTRLPMKDPHRDRQKALFFLDQYRLQNTVSYQNLSHFDRALALPNVRCQKWRPEHRSPLSLNP